VDVDVDVDVDVVVDVVGDGDGRETPSPPFPKVNIMVLMRTTRPATPADKELLRQIHHAAYRDVVERQFGSWDPADQDARFDQAFTTAGVRIIEVDSEPVGSIHVVVEDRHLFLANIDLLPAYQSRGIGSELIAAEIARARALGKPVRLQVLRANQRARALYERIGFRVIGEDEIRFFMILE
jgi:ribosomal protein S18 acetylase RimI-like enzyme